MVREREDVKQVYCLDMSGVLSLLLESKSQDEPGMVHQGTRQSVMREARHEDTKKEGNPWGHIEWLLGHPLSIYYLLITVCF